MNKNIHSESASTNSVHTVVMHLNGWIEREKNHLNYMAKDSNYFFTLYRKQKISLKKSLIEIWN